MLAVESLTVTHADKPLLGPVSFNVDKGSTLVIMGETGAGKSLIAQAIMGSLPNELKAHGQVVVEEQRVDNLSTAAREQLWGRTLSMLPQEPWHALDPLMKSYSQVYESHKLVSGLSSVQAKQNTQQDFKTLNLKLAQQKLPGQLSGGMSQRVAFAAAQAGGGTVLLADEPTKGLDADTRDIILGLLNNVPESGGTLVVITHDIDVARKVGGQILVLKDGDVVEAGDTQAVLKQPSHAYTQALLDADPNHWQEQTVITPGEPLLSCNQLVIGRQNKPLTSAIDLSLTEQGRLAINGPSGLGKTTLLDTLAGLIKPVSGRVIHEQKFTATDIQKIYQDPPSAFAPHITLRKSLRDVAKLHKAPWSQVETLLEKLGVSTTLLERKPNAVSGGELQRIAITRALLVKPKLLLADEPTSRLDPITQKQTMDLLAEVTRLSETSVVLVTHDVAMANKWADSSFSLHPQKSLNH